jgi:hypothetical protein
MDAHNTSNNIHTRAIAEFVSGLRYEKIPKEVLERCKELCPKVGDGEIRRRFEVA